MKEKVEELATEKDIDALKDGALVRTALPGVTGTAMVQRTHPQVDLGKYDVIGFETQDAVAYWRRETLDVQGNKIVPKYSI